SSARPGARAGAPLQPEQRRAEVRSAPASREVMPGRRHRSRSTEAQPKNRRSSRMTYLKKRGGRFWLPAGLGSLVAVAALAAFLATGAAGKPSATPIRIALLSDCAGPFGNQFNADLGGAEAAFAQFAGAKLKDPGNPSKGFTGGSVNGHPLQLAGIGCS